MWIITKDRLRRFWEVHELARLQSEDWYRVADKARWENINDVRRVFPRKKDPGKKGRQVLRVVRFTLFGL